MDWEDAYIGFGSNIGEPILNVRRALKSLHAVSEVQAIRVSSLYRTEPVGWEAQPWFVNGVAWIKTCLGPASLMENMLRIENHMGRFRAFPDGPRVIDMDLLFYGERVIEQDHLKVPHPRMHERGFVLVPLCEIAPDVLHPAFAKTCRELLAELRDPKTVERLGNWEELRWPGSAG